MNRFLIPAGLLVALLGFSAPVAANTLIPANCGTCGAHNTSFDVSYDLINDANNIYEVTITATYGSPLDFLYINDLAFKIDAFDGKYDGTPTVVAPDDTWTVLAGGLSAGGCDSTGAGFYCAQSTNKGAQAGVAGSIDTWVFTLDVENGLANLGASTVGSLKAEFTDANGNKVGSLLSEGVSFTPTVVVTPTAAAVPEPASLLLLGSGLAMVARRSRRRRTE